MLPWIIMAAAQLLSQKQQQKKAQESLMLDQYKQNAREAGGSTRMADVMGGQMQIDNSSADYGPALLSLIGKSTSDDDDPQKVRPRSGVRLRMEDF